MSEASERIEAFQKAAQELREAVGQVVVGQAQVVEEVLVCLFAGGHALLEGAPGLGKTLLIRTLSEAMHLDFSRIQFTPDLMPSDIVGTNMVVEDEHGRKRFELQRGPIFGQLVLADEINRATPKTQSALLEAMAEGAVTIAGARHALKPPFVVLATENPIEMEGTYPLPEAQLDRFLFKIFVPSPDEDTLVGILEATTGTAKATVPRVVDGPTILAMRELVREVRVAGALTRYVARFVRASDPSTEAAAPAARELLRYGAGVRGAQAMLLAAKVVALMDGRAHVAFADLRRVALPALRHRLIPNFEAEADGISTDQIVTRLLDEVPEVSDGVATLAS
ncbi:MAG TPA: AAA family ATPase [Polyangiaceae bacterium LLY-WYZ-15_(1-7)]|nr:AAA family ATPase [Myxococcales bacterium]MAT25767.1 AAA family ATPase [Sandaracinus sp.]HJK95111.1 AAA family ATPase [Polyangiaceae bacterium LLY-WYZ-15_(1-7)]MBJ70751.1 AAA family ATPase [Sandaracinus sp.]HJL04350.1 AAA family ATPase [Polyangiaceae bacterium LLY-WYZ-15_(1-7)]